MDENGEKSPEPKTASSKGLFLVEGGQLTIPAGALSFSIDEDGRVKSELKEVRLSTDMVTPWISISLDHLISARTANGKVLAAEAENANDRLGRALQEEMAFSMQAIVAAATALEAFYTAIRDRSDLPDELIAKWRAERRRRSGQIVEVLRRAVGLPNRGTQNLKAMLKDLYRFRGWAVHPPSLAQRPEFRPDISRGVEWRYQAFQLSNATLLVRATLAIVAQISERAEKAADDGLKTFLEARSKSLKPSLDRWEREFGPLLEGDEQADASVERE